MIATAFEYPKITRSELKKYFDDFFARGGEIRRIPNPSHDAMDESRFRPWGNPSRLKGSDGEFVRTLPQWKTRKMIT